MDISISSPSRLSLASLPHDILLVILRSVNSFKTLLSLLSTCRVFEQLFRTHSTVIIPVLARRYFTTEEIRLLDLLRPGPNGATRLSREYFSEVSQGAFCYEGRQAICTTPGKFGNAEVKLL